YLLNDDFKAHRDEVEQMLEAYYDANARANLNGTDKELAQALGDLILGLKTKPAPVISLVVSEEESPAGLEAGRTTRERAVETKLAARGGATIGDEMVVFGALTDPNDPNAPARTAKGMIEVKWWFTRAGAITYTISLRKSADEEPMIVKEGSVGSAN